MAEKVLSAQDVIEGLDRLDAEEADTAADSADKPKDTATDKPDVRPEPKPEPKDTPPISTGNPALDVAWGLAERSVKKSCPDLDDADRQTLRDAAKDNPNRYMDLAEQWQAKLTARKPNPKDETERLTRELFDGGAPGGDPNVTRVPQPTPNEKIAKAVQAGDSRGIRKGLAETVEKEKLFGRGIRIAE